MWESILQGMACSMSHRGPDDHGVWFDAEKGIGLAHRRLSILDLSPEGHQPMLSASKRYVLTYNGEVYNYPELRKELEAADLAPDWRGHSDTEVLLAAFDAWGVREAASKFVGIFAFGVWDRGEKVLYLVRDQVGIKPLYYGEIDHGVLAFGSELKAIRAHHAFQDSVDRNSLALLLRHNYIGSPRTIHEKVYKLEPGTILEARWDPDNRAFKTEKHVYWSARTAFERGIREPLDLSDNDAIEALDALLRTSVKSQMVSDVPLGAFLSGGYDSSTVVALMQAQSDRPVKTFSIGFQEADFNEAPYARKIAEHLGTDHTELYVTPEDGLAIIPRLPVLFDEPFADSSQIPTFLLSELTRKHVTVSLSGDGGDELFAGYSRYFVTRALWRTMGWMPVSMRHLGVACLELASRIPGFERVAQATPFLSQHIGFRPSRDRFKKLADILSVETREELYRHIVSHWKQPDRIVLGASEPSTVLNEHGRWVKTEDLMTHMTYADTVTYLPDDILVKVDRASMGVSLEARVPLLDHRIVEFAARVPLEQKVRSGKGKWLLRQVLDRYVPKEMVDRPKMGFGVPIDSWLRGPLRDWAEALLSPERLKREGFFDPEPIRHRWNEHLSGTRHWHYYLWDVLMFQAWLEGQPGHR